MRNEPNFRYGQQPSVLVRRSDLSLYRNRPSDGLCACESCVTSSYSLHETVDEHCGSGTFGGGRFRPLWGCRRRPDELDPEEGLRAGNALVLLEAHRRQLLDAAVHDRRRVEAYLQLIQPAPAGEYPDHRLRRDVAAPLDPDRVSSSAHPQNCRGDSLNYP